jgi:hypothetical protein
MNSNNTDETRSLKVYMDYDYQWEIFNKKYGVLQQQLGELSDLNEHQINFIALAISSAKIENETKVQILTKLLNFYL